MALSFEGGLGVVDSVSGWYGESSSSIGTGSSFRVVLSFEGGVQPVESGLGVSN